MQRYAIGVLTLLALGTACGADAQQQPLKLQFIDPAGKANGSATLTQMSRGVLIELNLTGLAPGEHAFHIHQHGVCQPQDGFKSAGDHFSGAGHTHGFDSARGPHRGDMPNQFVGSDGTLRAQVFNAQVSLSPGVAGSLMDRDGSSLILHAKRDDYRSQPSGEAGDRIACAVIGGEVAGASR